MTTRDEVLARLRRACGATVSGEQIASELGMSRVAVSKHVAALRAAGYDIAAVHGQGYRLISSPNVVTPLEVGAHVTHPLWTRIVGDAETGSTNDDARVLARAGAPEGTAVVAGRQTAGRGRLGRTWSSPAGGAYVSVILRPVVEPANIAPLSLVISVGVARGLKALGLAPRLKWPNDVWLGERKVAGILLEMSAEGDRVDWVVAGVGLNVVRGEDAFGEAAYVSDLDPDATAALVAGRVLDGIAQAYRCWIDEGFSALAQEFARVSVLTGREVAVSDVGGRVVAAGTVTGIDDTGRLVVVTAAGETVAVAVGDVTLRR